VLALAFHPRKPLLATGGHYHTVDVGDLQTGRPHNPGTVPARSSAAWRTAPTAGCWRSGRGGTNSASAAKPPS
jgi:hypothetical protein